MRSRRSARPPEGQTRRRRAAPHPHCRLRDGGTRPDRRIRRVGRDRGAAAHADRARSRTRISRSRRLRGRRRRRSLRPLGREERAEERTAFVGSHAVGHGQLMVEPGVGAEVVERAARSSARVARAEDEPADPGGNERARTHGARFEGDDHGDVGQSPISDDGRRVAQHQHLRVCGRVARVLALVVTRRHQSPIDERDGTHGYLALARRTARLAEGELHGGFIAQGCRGVGGDAPVCGAREREGSPPTDLPARLSSRSGCAGSVRAC